MVDLRKPVGEIVTLLDSGAPSVQVIKEVVEPAPSVQIPERNIELESAIFSGLPSLSEIPIESRIEDASRAVVIDDSDQLDHLQDRTQEMALAFDVSFENVVNLSIELAEIQP
ncbi:hypothetical protein Nepgr_011133 [Nepenthes gracilis]|uniref:Uncharacterized protein n=1 Tax=Nepenthes gracilis TaxID=150966 RepID=A0AAD3SDT6_NEPGR|nr:hypothetical protein Nepgr_011133 [Nepenthes gracilis]